MVARRAVEGVVEATKEIGGNVEEAAKVAVNGAVEAAGSIGNTSVKAVRDILVGAVKALKDVASAALPRSESASAPDPEKKPPSTLSE
jgi:hypothetical protein